MPLSTLQETPRDVSSKTRGQDGFATSFPVGLLHPLQHAGLSRRSPDGPSFPPTGRVVSKEGGLASFGSHRVEIRMAPFQAKLPKSR